MKIAARIYLAITAAILTVRAHPLDNGLPGCCTGLDRPFPAATCFPFSDGKDDGRCKPIWVNMNILRRATTEDGNHSISSVNTTIEEPITEQPTSKNPLAKNHLYFVPDPHGNPQEVCEYTWKRDQKPCMNREGRTAKRDDCLAIERFWTQSEWAGVWLLTPPDIAGQHWMNLFTHDTCTFSFGNKHPPVADNVETRMGNLDIARVVHDAATKCGTGEVEFRARRKRVNFHLYFWVTRFSGWNCCDEDPSTDWS